MAQFYVLLGRSEVEVFDEIIKCTILICDRTTLSLFDPRSIYSYVSIKFSLVLYFILILYILLFMFRAQLGV